MRAVRVLLVIVAVACLGVALSYPIRYRQAQDKNDSDMDQLAEMRRKTRQELIETSKDEAEALGLVWPQSDASAEDGGTPEAGDSAHSTVADQDGGTPEAGDSAHSTVADQYGGTSEAGDSAHSTVAYQDSGTPETGDSVHSTVADQDDRTPEAGDSVHSTAVGQDGAGANAVPASPESPSEFPSEDGRDFEDGAAVGGDPSDAAGGGTGDAPEYPAGGNGGGGEAQGANDAPGEPATPEPVPTPVPTPTPEPTLEPNYWDLGKYYVATPSPSPTPELQEAGGGIQPTPTPDRSIRKGPLPYALKDKVELDEAAILPELKEIYALNNDLVGWITIPDTVIDYPMVQSDDGEYYLSHDFYGEENINGQIILDVLCDPYTPSYNLVVSGHHMKNGSMFGGLPEYRNPKYWEKHKFLELDTLMARKHYVLFACFYSADYDEDETGFRYNAIIDYKMDADRWLQEIEENQLYDTGIEREFGDEFITLTTCDRSRHHNGRFVVVGRRIREGETFE